MSNELVASSGQDAFRISTDAAQLCKQIVVATAKPIKGKRFVGVEGWQAIALAHGCVASSGQVERVETGFRALGKVIRMSDGQTLSTAEGFVGDDEAMWAARPEYARRAMAQTRSISRACRSAFAHVVVMMQAGLETTPAEEMQDVDIAPKPHKAKDMGAATIVDEGDATLRALESAGVSTRETELAALCKQAGISPKFYLNRAGVDSASKLTDSDWTEIVATVKRKIKAAQDKEELGTV